MIVAKNYYEVGGIHRSGFRKELFRLAYLFDYFEWSEDKGLLSSIFYIKCSTEAMVAVDHLIDEY